jgi:nucleotide-binding universal stress UspA family protein
MTEWGGPTLFCFDGSDGSRAALGAAARRLRPGPAVVLTVWETVALRIASQAFAAAAPLDNEVQIDRQEEAAARTAAEEGAGLAREHGWDAHPRLVMAGHTTWAAIVEVADELDASLIVCGTRGLSGVRGLVLGSVSSAVLHHARRPVLVAPEPHPPEHEVGPA